LNRAVLLDRDGVLNALVWYADTEAHESPRSPKDVYVFTRVPMALRRLHEAGWLLLIVSNQPNLAKGKSTQQQLDAVHAEVLSQLSAAGCTVDGAYYCFHHPDFGAPCPCRKPQPGLLLQAAADHDLDLAQCWLVGDTDADIAAGHAAGCRTAALQEPRSAWRRGQVAADATCADLAQFAERLLSGTLRAG